MTFAEIRAEVLNFAWAFGLVGLMLFSAAVMLP